MGLKLIKYEKGVRQLPVKLQEFNISDSLVDDKIFVGEQFEVNEFFEMTLTTTNFKLDIDYLQNDVHELLKKNNLQTYVLGIEFEDDDLSIKGYISDESVEKEEFTGNYIVTTINWFKYIYEIVGAEYCPDPGQIVSTWSIQQWLLFTLESDIVKDVILIVPDENYVWMYNPLLLIISIYQKYGPFMTIKMMLDNIYKKMVGVFEVDNDFNLTYTSYDRPIGETIAIDNYINYKSFIEQPLKYSDYDAVITEEHGAFLVHTQVKDKIITSWAGEDGTIVKSDWKVLDLRQKALTISTEIGTYDAYRKDDNTFVISSGALSEPNYSGGTPSYSWIGKGLKINFGGLWGAIILDVNGDEITTGWLGLIQEYGTITPPEGNFVVNLCNLAEPAYQDLDFDEYGDSPYSNWPRIRAELKNDNLLSKDKDKTYWIAKTGEIFMKNWGEPIKPQYPELYRIFAPKSLAFCSTDSVDLRARQEITIQGNPYRVIRADKEISINNKYSELELEEL